MFKFHFNYHIVDFPFMSQISSQHFVAPTLRSMPSGQNFGYYAVTPFQQKHSKISNFEEPLKFWDIRSFGYLDVELTDTRRIGIMISLSGSVCFD